MRSVLNRLRAALDAVHLIALLQQELGQVGAVLAGDAGDECDFASWLIGMLKVRLEGAVVGKGAVS